MPLLFQVGVTGHRTERLAAANALEVRRSVNEVLLSVRTSVHGEAATRSDAASLRVLSSLAEGSDRMVAELGLALGYELHAPLPLEADDFERDFATAESRVAFRALVAKAREAFVVPHDALRSTTTERTRDAAYERAGRYVIHFSDLLLTIWDGEEPRGRGGTAQMVDEAIERGVPIVWVPLDDPQRIRVRTATGEMGDANEIPQLVRSALSAR